eukprot:815126-Pyramimonas_sp.AAC.1
MDALACYDFSLATTVYDCYVATVGGGECAQRVAKAPLTFCTSCASSSMLNSPGLPAREPYHPSAEGMRAVADAYGSSKARVCERRRSQGNKRAGRHGQEGA